LNKYLSEPDEDIGVELYEMAVNLKLPQLQQKCVDYLTSTKFKNLFERNGNLSRVNESTFRRLITKAKESSSDHTVKEYETVLINFFQDKLKSYSWKLFKLGLENLDKPQSNSIDNLNDERNAVTHSVNESMEQIKSECTKLLNQNVIYELEIIVRDEKIKELEKLCLELTNNLQLVSDVNEENDKMKNAQIIELQTSYLADKEQLRVISETTSQNQLSKTFTLSNNSKIFEVPMFKGPEKDWYWITTEQSFRPPFMASFRVHRQLDRIKNSWSAAVGLSERKFDASKNWREEPTYPYILGNGYKLYQAAAVPYGEKWESGEVIMIVNSDGDVQFIVNGNNLGTAYTVWGELYIMIAMFEGGKIELVNVE